MRKNTRKSVDSAALTSAWAKLFDSLSVDDLDAHFAEGWRTADAICKETKSPMNTVRARMNRLIELGRMETKKIRAKNGNMVREVSLYRPLT